MSKFTDNKDREWELLVNVPTIRDVRKTCKVNLGDPTGRAIDAIAKDPELLVDVLFVLCESQAKERDVSADDFGRALFGDEIDAATEALIEAHVNFSRGRTRLLLRKTMEKTKEARTLGMDVAIKKLEDPALMERVQAEMEKKMDREVEESLTRLSSATNSPVPPEST